jgi:transposase InsO family protein
MARDADRRLSELQRDHIPPDEGWLYQASTMDLFSRRIVGWSMVARLGPRP